MPPDGTKFLVLIAIRTLLVLLVLVLGLRLLGKRQTAQFTVYDLVLVMLLANAVQNAMTAGDGHLLVGIVSSGVLLCFGWVMARAFVNIPTLAQRIAGDSTLLVSDGQVIRENLVRERIEKDQLLAAMRQHGILELSAVRMAVLEVDGSISIIPRDAIHHSIRKDRKRARRQ